jgi:hypothetical protein
MWWPFPRPHGRGVLVGDGAFGFRVVGTLVHQDALETIAGKRTRDGYHRKCAALLAPQPANPYDRHAVAVFVHAVEIGYLDQIYAREFLGALHATDFADAACEAQIVGGWERRSGDRGYVGLRLNACLPFRIIDAESWYKGNRPSVKPITPKTG